MNIDKLMQAIAAVKPGRYDTKGSELTAIYRACGGDAFATSVNCFRYGYLKGRRAAKAEAKKAAAAEMERHANGYGLLLSIIERNMSNEQFIGKLCSRACALEGLLCGKEAPGHD